jgi:hypothetical protein
VALLLIDGFDAYGVNNTDVETNGILSTSGYIAQGSGNMKTSSNTRTSVGYSLNINEGSELIVSFTTSPSIVAGFAVNLQGTTGIIAEVMYNNLLGFITPQLVLYADGEAGVSITSGDGDLVGASPPNVLFPGTWQYLEILYSPSATSGSLQVKVDGSTVITLSGIKIGKSGAPNSCNQIKLGNFSSNISVSEGPNLSGCVGAYYDDFYLCDQTGAAFNTFLGDVVVHSIFPASDESPNQFVTQVGGSSGHFTSVNEQTPDDDTSYLADDTGSAYAVVTFTETSTNNFLNGDTVQIGSKTYTFKTSYTNTDGDVTLGTSFTASMVNLCNAVNLGSGAGSLYAALMTANTEVSAVAFATTGVFTALLPGTVGNSYPSVYTASGTAAGAFGSAALVTGAAGHKELYTVSTLPADIIDILAVAVCVRARKDAAGVASYQPCFVASATEADGPVVGVSTSYQTSQFLITSPPAGGAWTTGNVQAAYIGFLIP